MANSSISLVYSFLLVLLLPALKTPIVVAVHKHYVVYLGSHDSGNQLSGDPDSVIKSHHQIISLASKRNNSGVDPSKKLIYSLTKIFNAFAATLHEEEAEELAKNPDVISVFENGDLSLHTCRSWDFLDSFPYQGEPPTKNKESIWEKANYGEDMIIANMDTGVWPDAQSFSDEGYGPIPKKFKGQCDNELDPTFKCNRKLIGARFFYEGMAESLRLANASFPKAPNLRDSIGHGTHTLSTSGGNVVPGVNSTSLEYLGLTNVTIKGGAPRARVVAYKGMWQEFKQIVKTGGSFIDVMASVEAAIADNVDVINLSVGLIAELKKGMTPGDYYFQEPLSVASFHAISNGVSVVGSTGNTGPTPGSISCIAPWILTVGASSMDRKFECDVFLGNHQKIRAARVLDKEINETYYPLITGADARITGADMTNASYCIPGTLDPMKVKGKILVCLAEAAVSKTLPPKSVIAKQLEAVGLILANEKDAGLTVSSDLLNAIPTALMNYNDGQIVFSYINSTRTPTALFTKAKPELGVKPSPFIPDFSSRGPNPINPEILKPDVIAPGVSIIAAYTENTTNPLGPRAVHYFPATGTSMAAPHVTGVVALLKKLHPHWTTAAIKSALMTTASPVDNNGKPILKHDMVTEATPLDIGAGLIQPNLAMDPGLVYDMNHYDYLNFLCSYDTANIDTFTDQHKYKCPKSFNIMDFNYPAISIPEFKGSATATRRVKNVGQPGTYTARVQAPAGVSIVVEPNTLVFSKVDQEIQFKLVFSAEANHIPNDYKFGSLVWSDGKHDVRSPIIVKGKSPTAEKA